MVSLPKSGVRLCLQFCMAWGVWIGLVTAIEVQSASTKTTLPMFNWFLNCTHFSFQIALLFFFQIYYLNTHLWAHWYFFYFAFVGWWMGDSFNIAKGISDPRHWEVLNEYFDSESWMTFNTVSSKKKLKQALISLSNFSLALFCKRRERNRREYNISIINTPPWIVSLSAFLWENIFLWTS